MNQAAAMGKVLVVDDWRDSAESLAMLLNSAGYETATAYNGAQAVELAKSFQPDTVILDINMPVMDGHQAARELRQTLPDRHLILVALTALDQGTRPDSLSDFDLYLQKPCDTALLLRLISHLH
ncbi:MAG: response regulator [Aquabacterium sp.]|uniref:response regulator n=1 Tax=Aquabacterium sp. TaxID=1872578 RepID=UPI00271CEF66|nr:response regulator [Aquabacterium sp.]MDO9002483.1 response regulator [Aquabacterium sp.]